MNKQHGPNCSPPKDCYCGAVSTPSSPTSEPIPASDQLREALEKLSKAGQYTGYSRCAQQANPDKGYGPNIRKGEKDIADATCAVEDLFSAQLGEIERLRRENETYQQRLFEETRARDDDSAELASLRVERDRLEQWKVLAKADLRGLRSSALTAEEAELLLWELDRDEGHPYFTDAGYSTLIAKLSALRSSTADKGNTE